MAPNWPWGHQLSLPLEIGRGNSNPLAQGFKKKNPGFILTCTIVATRQDISLGPIVLGVLYGWRHGYAYTSVSRAFLFASWQTLGKPYVTQTSGKPYVIVLYRKTLCGACQYAKRNARETLVYAYPCHQPYSTPNTIGPRGTSWRVATSGVHASRAFLDNTGKHIERRGIIVYIDLNLDL